MTVYAEAVTQPSQPALSAPLTKTFSVLVWVEMDRVRIGSHHYTVTMTGQQSAQPADLTYTVNGNPATMQDVAEIIADAKCSQGSVEKVA